MDDSLEAARKITRQLRWLRESGDTVKQNSERAVQLLESIEEKMTELSRKPFK